jgi:hypothetical protein
MLRRPGASRRTLAVALLVGLALAGCDLVSPSNRQGSRSSASSARGESGGSNYDLAADEREGGHTLARHVGRSPAELADRLAHEHGVRTASTFPDRATAERAVAIALDRYRERIDSWCGRGPRRPNLALTVRSPDGRPFGLSLSRGDRSPREASAARVVLRARGEGFIVLTAYPTEER